VLNKVRPPIIKGFALSPNTLVMPIYAYKCGSCGHAKDVLQKISDPQLTVCPACGAEAFTKQVTAAGFQLKGSGWYVTDFRGGNGGSSAPATEGKSDSTGEAGATSSAPAAADTGAATKVAASAAPATTGVSAASSD
jgi:putative FmdB family regulatory protein